VAESQLVPFPFTQPGRVASQPSGGLHRSEEDRNVRIVVDLPKAETMPVMCAHRREYDCHPVHPNQGSRDRALTPQSSADRAPAHLVFVDYPDSHSISQDCGGAQDIEPWHGDTLKSVRAVEAAQFASPHLTAFECGFGERGS
jgi:hypothetical protein